MQSEEYDLWGIWIFNYRLWVVKAAMAALKRLFTFQFVICIRHAKHLSCAVIRICHWHLMFGSVIWIHHWYLPFEYFEYSTWICSWSRWCDVHSVAREHVLLWWEQQLVFCFQGWDYVTICCGSQVNMRFLNRSNGLGAKHKLLPADMPGQVPSGILFLTGVGPSDCLFEWRNEHSCSGNTSLR